MQRARETESDLICRYVIGQFSAQYSDSREAV